MVDSLRPIKHGTLWSYRAHKCRCDECCAAKKADTAKHAERSRERVRQWRIDNPERARTNTQAWKNANREKVRASGRAYRARRQVESPEEVRAYRREWAKTEKGRLANRLARHQRRGAPTDREYAEVILLDPCSYCGAPGGEIDHITPIADGGLGDWTNLTSACRTCNASKNDQPLLTFLMQKVSA